MEDKNKLALRLENVSVFIQGLLLLLFPIAISTVNTDAFAIPKQALLGLATIVCLVLLGAKSALTGSVRIRRTPFDLPVLLFTLSLLLSSILAVNKYDSLISFFPFLFAVLLFFTVTNSTKRKQDVLFLIGSLITGAVLVSVLSTLSYFKIYILPFAFAKVQTFTTFGSLFDQSIYLLLALALCLYMAWPAFKKRAVDRGRVAFIAAAVILLAGTLVSFIATINLQKPNILPYQTGFQIAGAAISQDNGRVVKGFLSGSGLGTFLSDFTRFKPASFNSNTSLWNLSFLRSSSLVFELIATTGLLGILSFVFLSYRILRSRPLFIPLLIALGLSLLIPFSFGVLVLFFALLGIYAAQEGVNERQKTRFFDVELKLVTLRRGVFALADPSSKAESEYGNLLPYGFTAALTVFALFLLIVIGKFVVSDYLFQQSLLAASQNNASKTYDLQTAAIKMFPQRDGYHRIFSQINLSLANNISASTPKGSSPSAQVQNTVYRLIQQSINSARNATTVSPQTAINWQNLASIYRSLIGFGQNADSFALLANQQAVALDPNNPQEYINYGGIFYQLGQWDNSIRQFQIAASLKPDFANAYYNLGHALEQKGDLKTALQQYQTVKSLVSNDKSSLAQIDSEIKALEARIGESTSGKAQAGTGENQPPLEVNQPAAQLPEQNPKVKIPAPKTSLTPTPSPTPSVGPTPNL